MAALNVLRSVFAQATRGGGGRLCLDAISLRPAVALATNKEYEKEYGAKKAEKAEKYKVWQERRRLAEDLAQRRGIVLPKNEAERQKSWEEAQSLVKDLAQSKKADKAERQKVWEERLPKLEDLVQGSGKVSV